MLVVPMLLVGSASSAGAAARLEPAAVQRDFSLRYSNNVNGQIVFASNVIVQCPTDTVDPSMNSGCLGSRAGTNARNNNSYDMRWLDADNDPATFDSSSAQLIVPTGAHVLFAGLYWTGVQAKGLVITGNNGFAGVPVAAPNVAQIDRVKFKVPGSSAYSTVVSTVVDTGPIANSSGYGAFADVTAQVVAAGAGTYTVADVQTGTGGNISAGWSLVVAYADDAEPLRNLSVFDGLKVVSQGKPLSIPLSGFKTPSSGTVRTTIGVVAAEGDAGTTGDYLTINSNLLTDAVHAPNNTENSTIANRGVQVTTKSPDWRNQLGYDASLFQADGFLANGDTTAIFAAQTTGDVYAPQAITFATELYSPDVSLTKTATVLAGDGVPRPGATVHYEITATNNGTQAAVAAEITDQLPAGLSLSGAPTVVPSGSATCAPAPCGATSRTIGATLGSIPAGGGTASVSFDATITDDRPLGEVIDNVATLTFVSPDLGLPISKVASAAVTVSYPDPGVTKTVTSSSGTSYSFDLVVTNDGTALTSGAVEVTDTLGANGVAITAMSGTGWSCSAGVCSRSDALAPGSSYPAISVQATFTAGQPVENTAELTGPSKGGQPSSVDSPARLNDSSIATSGSAPSAVLAISKAAVQPSVSIGETSEFRIETYNQGPSAATNTTVTDTVPAGLDIESVSSSHGSCSTAAGSGGTTIVTCSTTSLLVGDAMTVIIRVAPQLSLAGTSVTNTASATSDITVGTVSDSAGLAVRAVADLQLTKTVSDDVADPGDVVTWTLTGSNAGPQAASDVSIVDHLPPAVDLTQPITVTPSAGGVCSVSGSVVDCVWSGSTAVSTSVNVTIEATLRSSFDDSDPTEVQWRNAVNVADISALTDDVDPSNDSASAITRIVPFADLAVVVSGPGVIAPESSVTITFAVTNNGPSTAIEPYIIITHEPTLMMAWPVGCSTLSPTEWHCYTGDLTPGATWTLEVEVYADANSSGTTWYIPATVSSSTPDPIPENNTDMTPLTVTFPPTIVTVDPGEGPDSGGTEIIIDGSNLTSDTTVEVGGVPCTPVVLVTFGQLMCTTGAHPAGPVDVVITTGDGQTFTFRNGFTYVPPPAPVTPKFAG